MKLTVCVKSQRLNGKLMDQDGMGKSTKVSQKSTLVDCKTADTAQKCTL